MPLTPCVFIDLAQSRALATSPPVSQNTSLAPDRLICALIPSEMTCTIGTASRLVAYPMTRPLPLPGTACACGKTLLCFGGPLSAAPVATAAPTAPTASRLSTLSVRVLVRKRRDSRILDPFYAADAEHASPEGWSRVLLGDAPLGAGRRGWI